MNTIWQPIETAPTNSTNVLLRYIKKGKSYGTQVTGVPIIIEASFNGVSWVDALKRHIVDVTAQYAKNIPTHWMPKPPEPN
jgi:hypothetical protein